MYDGVNISPFEVMFVKVGGVVAPGCGQSGCHRPCPFRILATLCVPTPTAHHLIPHRHSLSPLLSACVLSTCPAEQVKEFLLDANWTTATSAKKYTAWARHQVGGSVVCQPLHVPALRQQLLGLPPRPPSAVPLLPSKTPSLHPLPSPHTTQLATACRHAPRPPVQVNLTDNEYIAKRQQLRHLKILHMRARGK